jgi:hypothetical protein
VEYKELLEKYLADGIDYNCKDNSISKAEQGDLEQLASDSYFTGWHNALEEVERIGNANSSIKELRLQRMRGQTEVLHAVEVLEYHNKNWLGQDNPTRSAQKQEILKEILECLPPNPLHSRV